MTPEQANTKYHKRMKRILRAIAKTCKSASYFPSLVDDFTDSEYSYNLNVRRHRDTSKIDDSFDVTFTICEESERSDGDGTGLAFSLDVVEYGGAIDGGMCPYNYTSALWAYDDDELERRFVMFEDCNPSSILDLVK